MSLFCIETDERKNTVAFKLAAFFFLLLLRHFVAIAVVANIYFYVFCVCTMTVLSIGGHRHTLYRLNDKLVFFLLDFFVVCSVNLKREMQTIL